MRLTNKDNSKRSTDAKKARAVRRVAGGSSNGAKKKMPPKAKSYSGERVEGKACVMTRF